MFKGSKLYSIITGSCPVCQKESIYANGQLYKPSETIKMKERCTYCNTKYKIEPSFFFGAMFVSYGVGVAIAIAVFILAYFFLGFSRLQSFFAIAGSLFILLPVILRLSRSIWINMFFKFDKNA